MSYISVKGKMITIGSKHKRKLNQSGQGMEFEAYNTLPEPIVAKHSGMIKPIGMIKPVPSDEDVLIQKLSKLAVQSAKDQGLIKRKTVNFYLNK